jgi:hypothetical protein
MTANEDAYTVETEDGRMFNVEWYAGYSDWDVGDTVILTVDSGFGFMVYGTYHTRVRVDEVTDLVPRRSSSVHCVLKSGWRASR